MRPLYLSPLSILLLALMIDCVIGAAVSCAVGAAGAWLVALVWGW